MRILYVAPKFDYGHVERGYSFEHHNFYEALSQMGHDLIYFDLLTETQQLGRPAMNRKLLELVRAEQPELMFSVVYDKTLYPRTVRTISEQTQTTTLNWFTDDHWRFESFSRHWTPCFNWVATTSAGALHKYLQHGLVNVIKTQWACNHFMYRKLNLPMIYDATFVGMRHGNREQIIEKFRSAGITLNVWGTGWDTGRLSQQQMIRVFNQSRININLSESSTTQAAQRPLRKLASRLVDTTVRNVRGAWRVQHMGRAVIDATRRTLGVVNEPLTMQIKGRNFEVPGCGGFMLTGMAENLAEYYEPGKEIAVFENVDDLIEKTRYFLAHEDERAQIAQAGFERTVRNHTYTHRFNELFELMGLSTTSGKPLYMPTRNDRSALRLAA